MQSFLTHSGQINDDDDDDFVHSVSATAAGCLSHKLMTMLMVILMTVFMILFLWPIAQP